MKIVAVVFSILVISSNLVQAQSVSTLISSGDSAAKVRDAVSALKFYEAAHSKDSTNAVALYKAAKVLVSLVEFESDPEKKKLNVAKAERFASKAFAIDSTSAEAHLVMALTLGRRSQLDMFSGLRNAPVIYKHARSCIAIKPDHGDCLHIIGAWHAELSARGEMARNMAASMSKNDIFKTANWDTAQVYLERAVNAEPKTVIHHLALGRVYKDRDKPDRQKARTQFEAAVKAPLKDFNDEEYKKQAKEELKAFDQSDAGVKK